MEQMAGKFCLITLLILGVTLRTTAFTCHPCDTSICEVPTGCHAGTVMDVCNCCLECAKGLNEECGGHWESSGKCAEGLTCVKPPVDYPTGDYYVYNHEIGKCQKS